MDCPCKGCTDRKAECHSRCPAYNDWRKIIDEERDARNGISEITNFLNRPTKRSRRRF